MIIKQLNRTDAEQLFVVGINASGSTISNGSFLCWDWRNATSAGNAVVQATASNLGLFAGVLAFHQPSYADMPSNSYGLIQVYGVHGSVAYNLGAASISAAGMALVPMATLWSGQSVAANVGALAGGAASAGLVVPRGAFIMTNDLSGSGWTQAFVRAL